MTSAGVPECPPVSATAARWQYAHVSEMLALYRHAFAVTAAGGTVRLSWAGRDMDATAWRRQFRLALDRRINLKVGPAPAWRKLDGLYQINLARDARALRDRRERRVILRSLSTPELRRRLGHLIEPWED